MAAILQARANAQIETARAAKGAASSEGSGEPRQAPTPEQVAAEKAKQRRAMSSAVTPTDTSGAKAAAATAAGATKQEAARPPTPVAPGKPEATPASGGEDGGAQSATGEATQAAATAQEAAAQAAAEAPPAVPPPVQAPPALETIDAGGRQVPADPLVEAGITGLGARIQALRAGAHQVQAAAAAERAQGYQMRAMLEAGRSAAADADAGTSSLKAHTAHRKGVVEQAKGALEVSNEKAETVASGAPQVSAKSDEGSEKSTPMATESRVLAEENASKTPEDGEAAGKSGEQGSKLTKVTTDMGSIDTTISQTKVRAEQLAGEAAQAKQANTASQAQISAAEKAIAKTDAKAAELTSKNQSAMSRLDGMAGQPAAHQGAADALDSQGTALNAASVQLEVRLLAAQQSYVAGMAGMPAPIPAVRGRAVQRAYEGRIKLDPAHAVSSALPPWLTGEEPSNAVAAAHHKATEDARRAAEIAEIEKEAGGHFEALSGSQKAGIALRLTGRNLLKGIGDTDLPKFGLTLLRGFVDPRVSLMGIVHGFGSIATGVANVFSAEQWAKDPLGNALKSSADIATGVTIVLGSVAGLAVAIGIILTAIAIIGSIFSFGAVGAALAPIIVFCGTVASTVGPWAIWAAGVALVLHSLVFIKNLIDAATASTASQLQQESEKMTEDAQNAGNMALQIGMAKAMEAGGKLLARRGGGTAPEGAPAGTAPEPVPAAAPEPVPTAAPEPVPAGAPEPVPVDAAPEPAHTGTPDAAPAGGPKPSLEPVDLPSGPPANDNALPVPEANEQVLAGTGTDGPVQIGSTQPSLTVIEGGAGAGERPVAIGGEGPGNGGGGSSPPVEAPTTTPDRGSGAGSGSSGGSGPTSGPEAGPVTEPSPAHKPASEPATTTKPSPANEAAGPSETRPSEVEPTRGLTDAEKWEQMEQALREQEAAESQPRTGQVRETYNTVEAAIGQVEGKATLVDTVRTENPGLRNQGFTETVYVVDSNGTQWTVARNPRTGQFSGAHPSSSN